jgi:hypothetical protein
MGFWTSFTASNPNVKKIYDWITRRGEIYKLQFYIPAIHSSIAFPVPDNSGN